MKSRRLMPAQKPQSRHHIDHPCTLIGSELASNSLGLERVGSNASIRPCACHFRSSPISGRIPNRFRPTPINGRYQTGPVGPFGAKERTLMPPIRRQGRQRPQTRCALPSALRTPSLDSDRCVANPRGQYTILIEVTGDGPGEMHLPKVELGATLIPSRGLRQFEA